MLFQKSCDLQQTLHIEHRILRQENILAPCRPETDAAELDAVPRGQNVPNLRLLVGIRDFGKC